MNPPPSKKSRRAIPLEEVDPDLCFLKEDGSEFVLGQELYVPSIYDVYDDHIESTEDSQTRTEEFGSNDDENEAVVNVEHDATAVKMEHDESETANSREGRMWRP